MPKPTVLTGPPGPVTNEVFFARVVEWCTNIRRATRLRYIVPTARRRIEVENAILNACCEGRALCQSPVETLDRFAQKLFIASEPSRLISWRAAAMIVEMLLSDAPADFPSLLGERTAPLPGLVREIVRSLRELKRFAVEPGRLLHDAGGDLKAKDLALVFRRYNAFLAEKGWNDLRDCLLVVGRRLADPIFRHDHLADVEWIVFDGFAEFSPSEMPIVRALAAQVETTFVFDSDPEIPGLFQSLPDLAAQPKERLLTGPFVPVARLALTGGEEPVLPTRPDVRLIEADTRDDEIEQIAAEIKQLLCEGVAQADIVIAVPNLEQYAELVEETFAAHGVPCTLARRAPLLESPVTAAALMLLEAPARGFERRGLIRLFQSPLVRFEENGSSVGSSALDDLAREMRIFRDKEAWLAGLRNRLARLESEQARPELQALDEEQSASPRSREHELRTLRSLENPLKSALDLLDGLRKSRPAAAYAASLRDLIARFGIKDLAEKLATSTAHSGAHMQSLRELLAVLEEIELLDRGRAEPRAVSLDRFIELLRSSVAATQVNAHTALEGIEVLDIRRAAERRSEVLFLAGLVEGAVPVPRRRDALLRPSTRDKLGLPDRERLAADAGIEVYRALASASEKLFLCRPKAEGDTPLLRPTLLERIEATLALTAEPKPRVPTSWAGLLLALGRHDRAFPPVEALLGNEAFAEQAALHAFAHSEAVRQARAAALGTPSPYAGRLSEHLLDEVCRVYDREHEFSATELETYRRCPFRFFATWLLGLAPIEEPEEEIPADKKGTLLHTIFRKFYAQWIAQRTPRRITPENYREALELLTAIAWRHLDEQPYSGFVWEKLRDRLLGRASSTGERTPGLFESFVREEIKTTGSVTACTPRYFELGFGRHRHAKPLDPASRKEPIAIEVGDRTIRLHGVIDRIDTNEGDGTFCVLDYKSGSTIPKASEIRKGLSLQLPIYIMAAREILGEAYRFAAAGYFQTKDASNCGKKGFLGNETLAPRAVDRRWSRSFTLDDEGLDNLLEEERKRIGESVVGIESGRFQVTDLAPDDAGCRSCDFKHICRYNGITVRTFRGRT